MSQARIPITKSLTLGQVVLVLGLLVGISSAIYQWNSGRSLWLDEAKLALNILDKDFVELLAPLDREQVAPIGYLWLQKGIVSVVGASEKNLRILSILSYLLSCWLLFLLAQKWFNNRFVHLMATTAFAGCYAMVYYASEVKQYPFDVLVVLWLVYSLLKDGKVEKIPWAKMCFIGLVGVFCSNISALVLPLIVLVWLYQLGVKKNEWLFLIPSVVWAGAFLFYYLVFVKDHPTQSVLSTYWSSYFMPTHFLSAEPYLFLFRTLSNEMLAFQTGLGRSVYVVLSLMVLGIVGALRSRQYLPVFLFLGMFVGHCLLSALELYPFAGRMSLYLTPWVMLFIAVGISTVTERLLRRNRWLYPVQAVFVLLLLYPTLQRLPIKREELKPALAVLEAHKVAAENLVAYPYTKAGLQLYERLGYTQLAQEAHYFTRTAFPLQVATLTQTNLWLVGSHVQVSVEGITDEALLLDAFKREGFQVAQQWHFEGAFLYHLHR